MRNGPPYPIKKPVEKSSNNSTIVKDAIASGTVLKQINREKQLRHTKDEHSPGKSYLDGDLDYAKELVNKLSGTGEPVMDSNGKWTNKERVVNSDIIGTCKDGSKSNLGMIVYSKTGTHIYPRKGGNDNA